jgi:hypothetical protein
VRINVTKKDRVVTSESTTYCCGDMQGAIEAENIRKPMLSAQKPALLLGNRVVNYCPFCSEEVEVQITEE